MWFGSIAPRSKCAHFRKQRGIIFLQPFVINQQRLHIPTSSEIRVRIACNQIFQCISVHHCFQLPCLKFYIQKSLSLTFIMRNLQRCCMSPSRSDTIFTRLTQGLDNEYGTVFANQIGGGINKSSRRSGIHHHSSQCWITFGFSSRLYYPAILCLATSCRWWCRFTFWTKCQW